MFFKITFDLFWRYEAGILYTVTPIFVFFASIKTFYVPISLLHIHRRLEEYFETSANNSRWSWNVYTCWCKLKTCNILNNVIRDGSEMLFDCKSCLLIALILRTSFITCPSKDMCVASAVLTVPWNKLCINWSSSEKIDQKMAIYIETSLRVLWL